MSDTAALPRRSLIPWMFVLSFAVVVAVNGLMVWFAVGSFSGLYTAKPRDRGLHYNEVAAAEQARDALGWRVETSWLPGSDRLQVALFDRSGKPLSGAQVRVELIRPAEKLLPIAATLAADGTGRYAAYVALPARGNWDIDISVDLEGRHFAKTRRMFLR